jgi:hypothetical protein
VKPFRITFQPVRGILATQHEANVVASKDRVRIGPSALRGKPLAIVGGGPSVLDHLEELRNWPGEIWAINWTAHWLADQGIGSKMTTVDSSIPFIPRAPLSKGAILGSCVSPVIFAEYPDAECFDMSEDAPGGTVGGSSTACRVPVLAVKMGWTDIHFFGCEGSFTEGRTHVYRNETQFVNYLKVKAGNTVYLTRDDLYMQCESLADVMLMFPAHFKNRSGGLLQGMIEHPDWEVVAISAALKAQLEQFGACGMYEGPDVPVGVQENVKETSDA